MKLRGSYILSSAFLIATLLFAQIGVNFFHRNHDVHENRPGTAPLKAGEAGIQKHDEHCKVCAIDFFNHAFVAAELNFVDQPCTVDHEKTVRDFDAHAFLSFTQGRSPPGLS